MEFVCNILNYRNIYIKLIILNCIIFFYFFIILLVISVKNLIDYVNNVFKDCNDLVYKKIKIKLRTYHIFYLETMSSGDRINDYVLKAISNKDSIANINKNLPSPHFINIDKKDQINFYLNNGYTILINSNKIYAIETKADLDRSISESTTEPSLYGPKDSFVENIQKNLGLVKRRMKTNHIKNKVKIIGRNSKTITNILFIDNITDMNLVYDIENKLNNIDIDGILDAGMIKRILDNDKNPFPSVKLTERPDLVSNALLSGKVVILVDGSPYALVLPAFLADFINPVSDNYSKPINNNFLKLLRLFCFFLSIIVPAYYIAVTNYNQETLPLPLLLNFTTQRSGVPFPAIVEAFVMIIICELLKESDLRFPNNYGSAISILGALILGEAAVNAGIVSPIMIIVVSITFISSLLFSDSEISGAIRIWRFIFLLFTAFYGLYGLSLAILCLLINLVSYKSMIASYTFPIEPFDNSYLKDSLLGFKNNRRSSYLTKNVIKSNIIKEK